MTKTIVRQYGRENQGHKDDRGAYRDWLKKNDSRLRSYGITEIASLAMYCGFPVEVVCPETSDRIIAIMKLSRLWDSPLLKQWYALAQYDNGHDWGDL